MGLRGYVFSVLEERTQHSFVRIVRSACSRARSSPRTRSGPSAHSCLSRPNFALDSGAATVEAPVPLALARDQRVQAVGLDPHGLRLALTGRAAPLARGARVVGSGGR